MWVDERVEFDEVVLGLIFWNGILLGEANEFFDVAFVPFDLKDQQE